MRRSGRTEADAPAAASHSARGGSVWLASTFAMVASEPLTL